MPPTTPNPLPPPSPLPPPQGPHPHYLALLAIIAIVIVATGALQYFTGEKAEDASLTAAVAGSGKDLGALTREILALSKQYQAATSEQQSVIAQKLNDLVLERKALMVSLAKKSPNDFVLAALPEGIRKQLPGAIQPLLEQETELQGTFSVLHADPTPEGGGEETLFELDATDGMRYHVRYASNAPSIVTGAKGKVKGYALENELVAIDSAGGGSTTISTSGTVSGATGTKNVLVILINFTSNATQPWTKEQVAATVFSNTKSTNLFYQSNSFDTVGLTGDVVGWYTIPYTNTGCSSNYNIWSNAAEQAAIAAGVPVSNYPHRVYLFNSKSECPWGGLGTIGGNPTRAWIPGYNDSSIIAHEFGHNLSARHAQWLNCGANQIDVYANCTISEYGDRSDVMGYTWGYYFEFNAPRKLGEGWLTPTTHLRTVTANGTYTISATETNDSSIKALKIVKPDTSDAYYLSYRQPIGTFDATMPAGFTGGAAIHIWNGSLTSQTKLIDTTPGDNSSLNAPLADGRSFIDPTNGLTFTQLSHSSTTVTVSVTFTGAQCVTAKPTLTLSPLTQSGAGTVPRTYSISVRNNDSSSCSTSSFLISGTIPSGWTSAFTPTALTLAPGATGSASVVVTPPADVVDGSYGFTVTATDSGVTVHSAVANGSYVSYTAPPDTKAPSLTITSPTNGTKIKGNGNVTFSASASDAGGMKTIVLSVDGVVKQTCSNTTLCSSSVGGKGLVAGTHTLVAVATDIAGNQTTATSTVTK